MSIRYLKSFELLIGRGRDLFILSTIKGGGVLNTFLSPKGGGVVGLITEKGTK